MKAELLSKQKTQGADRVKITSKVSRKKARMSRKNLVSNDF